ncbi:MAG: HAMP domain-containing histidine kinase [Deltaproteobacteria bacterium]|nr:HAMP domain-containing histidine kinase [Deltaproteobacteria bacterium]
MKAPQWLTQLVAPVPDAELREAAQMGRRVGPAFALGIAVVAPVVVLADIACGGTRVVPGLVFALALAGAFGALYVLSRAAIFARLPELFLLINGWLIVLAVSAAGFTQADGRNPVGIIAVFIPLATAAFVPWRPTWTLVLVLTVVTTRLALHGLFGELVTPTRPVTEALLTTGYGALAMIANQLHRRLWLRFESARGQLVARERMYALGCLAAGVAHELKTPSAAVLNAVHSIEQLGSELRQSIGHADVGPDDLVAISTEIDAAARLARQGAERVASFVHAIRESSRSPTDGARVEIDVAACVRDALLLLSHRLKAAGMRVAVDVPEGLVVRGDRGELEQILTNLVANAVDARVEGDRGSTVSITASQDAGVVGIVVQDEGTGVPEAIRDRIFEPLFTTRADGVGSGLGLAISRDLARGSFGGDLVLLPSERGACFYLTCAQRAPTLTSIRPVWTPRAASRAAARPRPA